MAWGFDDFGFDTYSNTETPSLDSSSFDYAGDLSSGWNMPDLGLDQPTGWDTPAFQDVANNLQSFALPDMQQPEGMGDVNPGLVQEPSLSTTPGETPRGLVGEPPGSGGGFWGAMDDILSGAGKFAQKITPLAQLGMTGLAAAQGIQGQRQAAQQYDVVRTGQERQNQIAQQQQDTAVRTEQRAGPTYDAGREAYDRAMRGEVPPSVNQQIENWKRGAKQLAAARAAKSGMGESSTLTQWYQWIDQQGESMRGNWVQSQMDYYLRAGETSNRMTGTGVNALAGAGNTTAQQVQVASQQQRSMEDLIGNANRILSRLNAAAA